MDKSTVKKYKYADAALFTALLAVFFVVTLRLFLNQSLGNDDYYPSDMMAYIRKMLGTETEYSFPYPIYFLVGRFFYLFGTTPESAMAIATGVLNAFGLVIVKLSMNSLCLNKDRDGMLSRIIVTVASFSLFTLSMLYFDGSRAMGIHFDYMGVFSPTPWHNGTYLAARPFATLAMVWGARTLSIYNSDDKEGKRRDYILFSFFLLLATMTKPSYTLVHLVTSATVMLFLLFRNKWKNFKAMFLLGLCYVPTLLDMLYQYSGVFTGVNSASEESGIGFAFMEVWSQYTDNMPLVILLGIAFPLVVLIFHFREMKTDGLFRFAWGLYIVGLLMAVCLYEKGFRAYHFNFSWGYMCGMYAVFFASIVVFVRQLLGLLAGDFSALDTRGKICSAAVVLTEACFLAAHVMCGLLYFYKLYNGAKYY